MVVLALETATRRGSLALLVDDRCVVDEGDATRTHSQRLPGAATALLAAHGRTVGDVDRFAIVAGPGSFTGLRVGMAVVQGFSLVTGRQVTPVPTLEAMGDAWRLTRPAGETPTTVVCVLDGQRGDLFYAAWRVSPGQPIEAGAPMIDPGVGSVDDLRRRIEGAAIPAPAVVVGLDLDRHLQALSMLRLDLIAVPMSLAEVAARTAVRRPELAVSPHALRPIYLRRPDAELARERAAQPRP